MKDREKHQEKNRPKPGSPTEEHHPAERTVAPPIEREHETAAGVFEEEKEREKKRS